VLRLGDQTVTESCRCLCAFVPLHQEDLERVDVIWECSQPF
jgi:hypothetical protein